MRFQLRSFAVGVLVTVGALIAISYGTNTVSRTVSGQEASARIPRLADGKPDLSGIWQAINTANWDLEDHASAPGPFYQLGAMGAVPGGVSVVEGGDIPYLPMSAARRSENSLNRLTRDPELNCFMPGIPRATYMPYPFQIVHGSGDVIFVYEYATSNRRINMGKPEEPLIDTWMGTSNGRWDGDSLVTEVTGLNGRAWLDRAGNFTSENVKVIERYALRSADHLDYEATIEDPTVFSRPWKIQMPLYRRLEKFPRLVEFKCVEFAEELMYGHLRKVPALPIAHIGETP